MKVDSQLELVAAATARDQILIAAHRGREDAMDAPDKIAALLDAVRVLDALSASYALIGGVAVGIHSGVPRATLDTDLAVISTQDRTAVVGALRASGFDLIGEYAHSVNLRHRSGEPVQLALDGAFDAMIQRAEEFQVGGVAVRIVRKADLIEMKRRAAADPARRKSKALRDEADVVLLLGDVPDPDEGW